MSQSRRFVIGPVDLSCRETATADPENSLRRDDLLEYDDRIHREIDEHTIFWGPYIALEPGVYLFSFRGRLDGELTIDFSHDSANTLLKKVTIDNFEKPVCLAITKPIRTFEVRAHRTPSLKLMRLEGIVVDYIAIADAAA